jgi:hypothetical protein
VNRQVPKSTILLLGVVALVFWVLAASYERGCHFNVHLTKRLYCTEPDGR